MVQYVPLGTNSQKLKSMEKEKEAYKTEFFVVMEKMRQDYKEGKLTHDEVLDILLELYKYSERMRQLVVLTVLDAD